MEWLLFENVFIRISQIQNVSLKSENEEKHIVTINLTSGYEVKKIISNKYGAINLFETIELILADNNKDSQEKNVVNLNLSYEEGEEQDGE